MTSSLGLPESRAELHDAPEGVGLRVILMGTEPELAKVPQSFTEVDPVAFELSSGDSAVGPTIQKGGARMVVLDLLLPEERLAEAVASARGAQVRTIIGVSRRDTSVLRRRAERLQLDAAIFQRRPRNAIVEVIRNTIQYEIRRVPRAAMSAPIRLNAEGLTTEGEVINIGADGLLVLSPRQIACRMAANISFDLPGRGLRVIASASVVRSVAYATGYLVGLRFEAISDSDREQIDRYVRKSLRPPDERLDPRQRVRQAPRVTSLGTSALRATITAADGRRDHLRVRDLSPAGTFLFPKPAFDHPHTLGQIVKVSIRGTRSTIEVEGRIQRVVLKGSLEAQLFPGGVAIEFVGERPLEGAIDALLGRN